MVCELLADTTRLRSRAMRRSTTSDRAGRGARPSGAAPGVRLARAGLSSTLALTAAVACGHPVPPPNALIVTFDTTRADAVGAHGGPPGITPRLDALASGGLTFTRARTVTPLTLPAHASMMTGLYPPRHGVRDNEIWSVPEAALTLAELAAEAGYATAGFVAAPVLDRVFGIAQGFEHWSQPGREVQETAAEGHVGSLPSEEVADRALTWLAGRDRSRPFLAWVHFYDPHLPLAAPARFLEQARGHPYLAEVARVDFALGRLLDALDEGGELERTAVLVLGDHGEGNGDHGEATHGHFVFDTTLRVPFVVRPQVGAPGTFVPGARDDRPASVTDLYPTVAGLLGLPLEAGLDGRDLLDAPSEGGRGVYFESYHGFLHSGWAPVAGWAEAKEKYVQSTDPELYRVDRDPGERRDVIAEASATSLEHHRARIAAVAGARALPTETAEVDEELADQIRALGYVEVSSERELPDPLEDTGLPSPHRQKAELDLLGRAGDLARAEDHAGAIEAFRQVLARNPRSSIARGGMAFAMMEAGRYEDAVVELEALLSAGPESASRHTSLAKCLDALQDDGRAIVHYRRALELDPGAVDVLRALARVLNRTGEREEAARLLERAEQLFLRQ